MRWRTAVVLSGIYRISIDNTSKGGDSVMYGRDGRNGRDGPDKCF